jgi:hypothetical protein
MLKVVQDLFVEIDGDGEGSIGRIYLGLNRGDAGWCVVCYDLT